jgi:HK97 family phage portal protein
MNKKDMKPGWVKAKVLNWLGFGLTDHEHWAALYGKESGTGIQVTAEKALTLSAVWACLRLVSQTIATLPLNLYEKQGNGRVVADRHDIHRLIRRKPNAMMTAPIFWEAMIGNAMLTGDGYAEKKRIGGRVVALELLSPAKLVIESSGGRRRYRYTDDDGTQRMIAQEDIFHIPGYTLNGKCGLSVISYGVEVFGSALAADSAAAATFKNGLMPTTFFKIEKALSPTQRTEFRDGGLKELSGALNAGKSPLLEGGMDVGQVGINPKDAQLLESRAFSIEEVCRWFGVPPSMIGHTDKASSWASSAESINLWFLQYGLRPWLKRIEEAIWDGLIVPADQPRYFAEFSVEGLLRADTKGRSELYASALQNGWLNRNEVRALENEPPIEGGDVHTVQSNLLPILKLGQEKQPDPVDVMAAKMLERSLNEQG